MADIEITQAEADALISMEKHCTEGKTWLFPQPEADWRWSWRHQIGEAPGSSEDDAKWLRG